MLPPHRTLERCGGHIPQARWPRNEMDIIRAQIYTDTCVRVCDECACECQRQHLNHRAERARLLLFWGTGLSTQQLTQMLCVEHPAPAPIYFTNNNSLCVCVLIPTLNTYVHACYVF